MKYKGIIFISVLVLVAVYLSYRVGKEQNKNLSYQSSPAQTTRTGTLDTKTSEGNVEVSVTPRKIKAGSQAIFDVGFNTHTIDLDYDVLEISELKDDNGNIYKPLSWTGKKGGHHISGTLTFPKISSQVSSVTFKIPGIDNQDRVFSWDLKG